MKKEKKFNKKSIDIRTCEFVSPGHPDKLCDKLADSILDAYLKKDKESRVAIEILAGHKVVNISGEVKSSCKDVNFKKIVKDILGKGYNLNVKIEKQSQEISRGVDSGGAGDQGIMVGYACNETESLMPVEYDLSRKLCKEIYNKFPYDGKVQITLDYNIFESSGFVEAVVVSFQNSSKKELEKIVKEKIKARKYLINPAGDWFLGGLEADSGLSGRKIVIDSYGPQISVGGGSFSGKDFTKVDRSGAYMARKIAVDLLKKNKSKEVVVRLAYAIGIKEPVMATANIDGVIVNLLTNNYHYDLSPSGIKKVLKLDNIEYKDLSNWGHFGRGLCWDW
ncbi:methionine adenosyltransferase [bacterium]|nr:methionine adenosyltransferase [bacterium]